MKHILNAPGGGWELSGYFNYLNSNREAMPTEVFEFALDQRNYDLTSHQSLHDAWLEWILVSEPATGARSEIRSTQIECRFLGPYHDQFIEIKYLGVSSYKLLSADQSSTNNAVAHGDLLMHEVRVDGAHVIHEMVFSNGATFEIMCQTFKHCLVARDIT